MSKCWEDIRCEIATQIYANKLSVSQVHGAFDQNGILPSMARNAVRQANVLVKALKDIDMEDGVE